MGLKHVEDDRICRIAPLPVGNSADDVGKVFIAGEDLCRFAARRPGRQTIDRAAPDRTTSGGIRMDAQEEIRPVFPGDHDPFTE